MKTEMLINVLQPEECRIAILENGVLEELYVERTSHESYVGNIYKGRIVNIEPSIQAAFVDFGVGRNGFLHVSDVEPTYYRHLEQSRPEGRQRDDRRGRRDERREDRREERREDRRDDRRPRREDRPPPRDRERQEEPVRPERRPEPPVDTGRRRFGADLLEDMPSEEPQAEMMEPVIEEVPAWEPEPEPVVETPALAPEMEAPEPEPSVEEPETPQEKPRKRATTRKKKTTEGKPRRTTRKKPRAGTDEPPPEVMEGAERRTDDGSDPRGLDPDSNPEDELLSFRRSRPAPRQEQVRPASYPEEQVERFSPESGPEIPEVEEPAHVEPVEEEPMPRSRRDEGRRGGGRRRMSIEEELEADLRAADVGPARSEFVPPPPVLEEEPPVAEPAIEEPDTEAAEFVETVLEESWPETTVMEPDEEFAPRPATREQDFEDRPRRGDRGDRGDRGGRGDRGDRGGRGERDRGPRGRGRDRGDRGDRGGRGEGDRRRRGPMGRDGDGRPKPLIQDIFKRGQEVIVQVIKEHLGTKGPTLSTYISIPGRYLVLMPGLNRVGVSRKIQDEEQRRRLKDIFTRLKPPRGVGFIIRTAGEDKSEKELQRDLAYLSRLWQVVVRRIRKEKSPEEVYQESDMITRHIRDTFTGDIDKIIIDGPVAFEQAQEFLQIVMPKYADRIELYEGVEPLFHKYGIEKEIDKIHLKKVPLPNGGSIVIEQTEALVAIDVNSGNFRADRNDPEETAYQINLQAAKEIARQLRLRDLAGVIVNDFIDMREERRRRNVENALRDAVRRDRSRIKILRMSAFGIIEMTRQRVRTSLKRSVFQECSHCAGSGHVKTPESMSLEVMRVVQLAACREYVRRVDVTVTEAVANYLHNVKRKELTQLEQTGNMTVHITGQPGAPPETLQLVCYDNNNNEVKLFAVEERRPQRR